MNDYPAPSPRVQRVLDRTRWVHGAVTRASRFAVDGPTWLPVAVRNVPLYLVAGAFIVHARFIR